MLKTSRKVNYKFSTSNSFCCCIYSEEYITESLQPEPSFPPHPPDVTWLGMQKNRTISTGERGTRARSLCRGGRPHWERQGSQRRAARRVMQRPQPNASCKEQPPRTRQAHPQKRTLGPRVNCGLPGRRQASSLFYRERV